MEKQAASIAKWILLFALSIGIIILALIFEQRLAAFRSLGLLGIFLINLVASATVILPAPAIATVVAGGSLYHPVLVALAAAAGSSLGEATGFLLGHSGQHIVLRGQERKWYRFLTKLFSKYGGWMIFIFALIPNPLFDVIGIIAGVTSFSLKKFLFIIFLGRVTRDILLALLGASL